jgi:hypothetical protein
MVSRGCGGVLNMDSVAGYYLLLGTAARISTDLGTFICFLSLARLTGIGRFPKA